MHFARDVSEYLSGSKFSPGINVSLAGNNTSATNRIEFISALAAGRSILHIGFADHLDLIRNKIVEQKWLHAILVEQSRLCLGVDINQEAVAFCRDQFGLRGVYCHDVANDEPLSAIVDNRWDYAILGEVLEHLPNPAFFLTSLREKYGRCIDKLIVTVPNAWELSNLYGACRRIEYINSDHRFWFTPYTLAKVAADGGFLTDELHFVGTPIRRSVIGRYLTHRFPMLRDTLIGVLRPT